MASTSGRLPPGERSRLKTDVDYLLLRVLQEFKNRDKYGRGLITGAAFSNVLDDFGLTYGQPEVAKILEYCVINGDGFVIYKDLIKKYSPGTPRAKQSESEKFLLKANELAMKQEPHLQTHWTHAPKLPDLHDQMEMSEYSRVFYRTLPNIIAHPVAAPRPPLNPRKPPRCCPKF